MKDISELDEIMIELLECVSFEPLKITEMGKKLIEEVGDYAERTDSYRKNIGRADEIEPLSAQQALEYLLDRISSAPTALHRNVSIILLMPVVRKKLKEEGYLERV